MTDTKEDFSEIKVTLPGERSSKSIPQRKLDYGAKLKGLLDEYSKILICGVTNVGSRQIADLRKALRGRARFLFGKNTLIRKVIRDHIKETGNKRLKPLMDICKGNTGFCFTKDSIPDLRKILVNEKKQCPAKAGAVAPVDVFVDPGPTGMEPNQTGFFQAMDIPTRINKGQIDITDQKQVVFKGKKVGASEALLLVRLGIKPFYYGLTVDYIFDNGEAYDASVLDITDNDIADAVFAGLSMISALSFELDYPSITTVPHTVIRAYKKMLSAGLGFENYSWEGLKFVKEVLENPDAFRAAPTSGAPATAAPVVEKEESESEKESEAGPTDMFGGGDESSSE